MGDLLIVDDEGTPRRNPQVHAVLTVNADNLLELYCQAKTLGNRLLTMVDRASVGDHPEAIPVYHLHGALDARGENFLEDLEELDDNLLPDLVFRESEYYETIASPTRFVNHTPQSYLQRLNVLFIGTSLEDLNIRRWLYSSFRERVEQRTKYLLELHCRRYRDAVVEAELESARHFWLRKRTDGSDPNLSRFVESTMRKLGVQVIWCESYDDVCACISELKEKGKERDFGRRSAPALISSS